MRITAKILTLVCLFSLTACQQSIFEKQTVAPTALKDVPSQRLNFRFEADVPPPNDPNQKAQTEQKNPAIQNDFDTNRPLEILVKTIASPDNRRVLVVYSKASDLPDEFRLDMYSAEGGLLRHVTPDGMAVHFPETIVWSPDSENVAFVGMIRAGQTAPALPNAEANSNTANDTNSQTNSNNESNSAANTETANANLDANNSAVNNAPVSTPAAAAPNNVLTFRTEQIYICSSEGDGLKPLTQTEGLIYFYYVWSPDSSSLAALAAKFNEWNYLKFQADKANEVFTPQGRPRIVEKTGRERHLDDNLTSVRPVWSPDSAKVAVAFDKQLRIYDTFSEAPTQAAIPLKNQLLISSQKYDQNLIAQEQNGNVNSESNNQPAQNSASNNANQSVVQPTPIDPTISTLPDESSLVSFNPIINLVWEQDSLLYLQTGFVKQYKTGDGARSYLRWHRVILSPQAVPLSN